MTTATAAFPRPSPRGDRAVVGVELGVEPPIRFGDDRLDSAERRRASLRWLAGVALAGLERRGADRRGALFRSRPPVDFRRGAGIRRDRRRRRIRAEEGVNPGKGDRLVRPVDIVAAKQTYSVPTTIKIGDKEVVKARPFTRCRRPSPLTPTSFADAVPPFDPLKADQRFGRQRRRRARSRARAGRRRGRLHADAT